MNRPAHHGADGRFRNPWPDAELSSLSAMPRWTLQRIAGAMAGTLPKDPPPGSFPLVRPAFAAPRAPLDEWRVTWVGHSTCLLQAGALNILTDPVWSAHASPVQGVGPRRRVPPAVALDALPPLDLLLISHNHYDHFDTGTIAALAAAHPAASWLCPLGLAPSLRALGVRSPMEFDWWEGRAVETPGGVAEVTATPAQHFSGRTPWDRNATLWCGWSVAAGAHRLYFAGDSGLHPEFNRIGRTCGPFDAALMPIGAYDPRWFMRPVHMNPEEAVEAFDALTGGAGATHGAFIPIHWGTFKLTDEAMDEPPRRLRADWKRRGFPAQALRVVRHGETTGSF